MPAMTALPGMEIPLDLSTLPFAEALARLDAIVEQLETEPNTGLEEALRLYETGMVLAATCRQTLATAQLRLTTITVAAMPEIEQ